MIPATQQHVEAAREFIAKKWAERAKELGREKPENTKTACKFASMFAHRVFGGTLEGNAQHQYLRTSDGHVLDLTDWTDESAYSHDASFFHNPEHAESMGHCKARVDRWVADFMQKMPLKESETLDVFDWSRRVNWKVEDVPFVEGTPSPEKAAALDKWFRAKRNDKYNPTYVRLYHGTCPLLPIEDKGLLPTSATRRRSFQSSSGFVYLAVTPDRAATFGRMGNQGRCSVYEVIVKVRDMLPDKDQLNNQQGVGNDVKDTIGHSLVYGGGVRVKGRLEPWQIRKLPPLRGIRESLIQEGKVRIEHWSEEMDDPWEVADKAERAFRASGLRPMNSKELGYVAFDEHDNPIGATYHQVRQQPAEDFGGPEDDFVTVFEFDVGVDPKHQGGVVGWMLCKAAIQSAKWDDADLIRNWVINPKMADMLERLFGFEHESEPETREGYSSHMVKWLTHMDTSVTESIKCAAIRYEGQIYTGNSHFECYTNAAAAAGIDPEDQWAWVESRWDDIVSDDGFLTDDGRFLNREEAHEEAVASRQAARKHEGSLDSEDLYVKSHADALIRAHT